MVLTCLVASFQFLLNLKLTKNKITSMKSLTVPPKEPEEGEEPLPQWPVLQTLNLQDNSIKELGPISNCPNLRYLDLSDNSINSISEEFDGHPTLVELDLGINQLNNLSKLGGMPELKKLDLKNNRIKELQGLDGLGNLESLKLRGNMIQQFEEGVPELENLREIDLSMNMISKIEEIEKLNTLENLKVLKIKHTLFIENHSENYMFQILSKLMKLEQINDFKVNSSMRQ